MPPFAYDPAAAPPAQASDLPTGAIILIAFGVLFLLGTLGIFNGDWVGRGWPVVIIGVGVWLFIRRSREANARQNPPVGGPTAGGGPR